jgi:hypothetical protein
MEVLEMCPMRVYSAARMKGNSMGHANAMPHEGTQLRAIWDRFQAARGLAIEITFLEHKNTIPKLRDYYGLDIRRIGNRRWCLCGEWIIGGGYIDYVAARHQDTVDGLQGGLR